MPFPAKMIPERVSEITSATCKNEKLFETPIGRFSFLANYFLYPNNHIV
jgi:hypothetical protein